MDKWLISLILTVFLNFLSKNAISGIGLESEENKEKTVACFRLSGEAMDMLHSLGPGSKAAIRSCCTARDKNVFLWT